MSVTLLRAAERTATPWRNGAGVTREVAAEPPGAGFEEFTWRVSLAEITLPGPFSAYDGVDRIFAVARGRLDLSIDGRRTVLSAGDTPLAFAGETSVSTELVDDAVQALNVMTRRGRARAAVGRISRGDIVPASTAMILVAADPLRLRCADGDWRALGCWDAALIEPACGIAVDGEAWLVSIQAAAASSSAP